jgi:hypothetical protein
MECINKFFSPFTVGHHMKEKAVGNIFKETPEKYAADESKYNSSGSKAQPGTTVIQHVYYNRKIYTPDDQGMCFGKHLKKIILEQASLTFIMNFLKLHGTKIRKGMRGENGVLA